MIDSVVFSGYDGFGLWKKEEVELVRYLVYELWIWYIILYVIVGCVCSLSVGLVLMLVMMMLCGFYF